MKTLVLTLLLSAGCALAQTWTDRAEFDLALAVRAQADPAARLQLLDDWKKKYPSSAMRQVRAELVLAAAQTLGDPARMFEAARELAAGDAKSLVGHYWITVLGPGSRNAAQRVAEIDASAKFLLASAPAAQKEQRAVEALAHRTAGWAAWQRGDLEAAEKALRLALEAQPENAQASAWLGSVIATQPASARQVEAIWHLARAAYLDGDGALTAAERREVRKLLDAVYTGYHGALDGLEEIGTATRASVMPAAGFKVESAGELARRRYEEELERTNPELLAWIRLRERLDGPDSEAQFQSLSGTPLPRLKGYVIRCNSASKPKEVFLGLKDSALEEVVLKLDTPFPKCTEQGIALRFEGMAAAFTKDPFLLTVSVAQAAIEGWQ